MYIYNSIGRRKEKFVPIIEGEVSLYVCGMTVYDLCHIGHARILIFFDIVTRWFEASGFNVKYIRNITDVDDKIILKSAEKGVSVEKLTTQFIDAMHKDERNLGVSSPTHEPRASEHINEMLDLIKKLLNSGHAYVAGADVNYAVRSFEDYGKLSGKSIDQLQAGKRVEIDGSKKDPLDFVLWKGKKPDEPNDVAWESPYGKGRPGWHIECSAMSNTFLGKKFDIHGGGIDLQFPHHENEIAQSEAGYLGAKGESHVNFWMHVGFVTIEDEKMSKSTGNTTTIENILSIVNPEVLRYFLIRGHYRSPLNYSISLLNDAKAALCKLYELLDFLGETEAVAASQAKLCIREMMNSKNEYVVKFREAMSDDFNTPKALSIMFVFGKRIKEIFDKNNKGHLESEIKSFRGMGLCLGILNRSLKEVIDKKSLRNLSISKVEIEELIVKRDQAKKQKNYSLADEIRKELKEKGIDLRDSPQGTSWQTCN